MWKYFELKAKDRTITQLLNTQLERHGIYPLHSRGVFGSIGIWPLDAPFVDHQRHHRTLTVNTSPVSTSRAVATYFKIGVNAGKAMIYERLNLREDAKGNPPFGMFHFPVDSWCDEEYFERLTIEDGRETHYKGQVYTQFFCPEGARNEPLDTMNYACAACELLNPQFKRIRENLTKANPRPSAETDSPRPSG